MLGVDGCGWEWMGVGGSGWVWVGVGGWEWKWLLIYNMVKCAQYVHIGVWSVCSVQCADVVYVTWYVLVG